MSVLQGTPSLSLLDKQLMVLDPVPFCLLSSLPSTSALPTARPVDAFQSEGDFVLFPFALLLQLWEAGRGGIKVKPEPGGGAGL